MRASSRRCIISGVAAPKIAVLGAAVLAICRGASLQGQVTATTGEPVKNATVRLQRAVAPSVLLPQDQAPPPANVYDTTTDAAGNFVFESIDPGNYFVTTQRAGYLRQDGTIVIGPSGSATVAAFKLTPESRIEGRVTNQAGEPFAGARVSVSRWFGVGPFLHLLPAGDEATAAEDGSFVIADLPAGHYLVSATPPNQPEPEQEKARETDIATYFPGVAAAPSATLLNVVGGAVVQGIDIRVLKGVVSSVRGEAIDNSTGSPIANASIMLFRDGPEQQVAAAAATRADGTFELTAGPGDYIARARPLPSSASDAGQSSTLFADQRITVGEENLEGVVLRLSAAATIEGRFIMEDTGRQPAPGPSIILYSASPSQFAGTQVPSNLDGSFLIQQLGPAEYAAGFAGLPAGTYVKSIHYGQQDVTNKSIRVTSGIGGTLEVLLSPHAADVSGVVRNQNGDPMPGIQVTVWRPGLAAEGSAVTKLQRVIPNRQSCARRVPSRGVADFQSVAGAGGS